MRPLRGPSPALKRSKHPKLVRISNVFQFQRFQLIIKLATTACPICGCVPPAPSFPAGAQDDLSPTQNEPLPHTCTDCGFDFCVVCGSTWHISESLSHNGIPCRNFREYANPDALSLADELVDKSKLSAAEDQGAGVGLTRATVSEPSVFLSECPICLSDAVLLHWGAGCDHEMCELCCLRQVRNELGPTRTSVGCPFDGTPVSEGTLAAIASYDPPADSGERVLASIEVARAEFRLAVIAAGPRIRLVPCPDCHAPLPAPGRGAPALSFCEGRKGVSCGKAVCAACGSSWLAVGDLRHDAFTTCTAFGEAIAAVEAASAAAAAASSGGASGAQITATFKQCPVCNEGITHYRGHACHHIVPGRGCPTCASRGATTHFCYVCLGPWPCAGEHGWRCCGQDNLLHVHWHPPAGPGGNGCWPYCDEACDCPDCPECAPNAPCDHCSGPLSGCRVCAGATNVQEWRATYVVEVRISRMMWHAIFVLPPLVAVAPAHEPLAWLRGG